MTPACIPHDHALWALLCIGFLFALVVGAAVLAMMEQSGGNW